MTDFYLKAATEADMNAALIAANMLVEQQIGQDENDEPVFARVPTEGTLVDVIGPIIKWDYSVDPPVEIDYPDWHVNVRCLYELSEEQTTAIEPVLITPPELPYRVWA